jgi:hypothetical protein
MGRVYTLDSGEKPRFAVRRHCYRLNQVVNQIVVKKSLRVPRNAAPHLLLTNRVAVGSCGI